jgi:hypothetical protein
MVMNVLISPYLEVSYPDIRIIENNGHTLTAAVNTRKLNLLEKGQEVVLRDRPGRASGNRGNIANIIENKENLIVEIAKTA